MILFHRRVSFWLLITVLLLLIAGTLIFLQPFLVSLFLPDNLTLYPSPVTFASNEANISISFKEDTPSFSILSTGDLMVGRSVNAIGYQKRDFGWSLKNISPFLQSFSYVVANLETPIISNCPVTNEGMIFCADAKVAPELHHAGINLLTLANNHIANYGRLGIEETQVILADNQLDCALEGQLFSKEFGDTKVGFLSFDDTIKPLNFDDYQQSIQSAKKQVAVLFVALHFGSEYHYQPTTRQIELAHLAIDAGADIILGNHSHWLSKLELYGSGAIIYSHGNFIFDQMWSEETKQGLAIAWHFENQHLDKITIYPIYITNFGLANLAVNKQAEKILQTFAEVSNLPPPTNQHYLELDLAKK